MSLIAFSLFYDHLLPELPGCTTDMVDLHLRAVAREFCERSAAWRHSWVQGCDAEQATFDIAQPELQSEIVRVVKLTVDEVLLWDATWKSLPRPSLTQAETEPKYDRGNPPFTMNDENTELTLIESEVPTAADDEGVAITAALKPAFDATKLPSFLRTQQLEAMRGGTLARLMRMAGKPWANAALSTVYETEFQRLIGLAAHRAQQGNTGARLRTTKSRI